MEGITLSAITSKLCHQESQQGYTKIPAAETTRDDWIQYCIKYNDYKLTYKKMEVDQNKLTSLMASLLSGGEYLLESYDNTSATFESLENFKMDVINELVTPLENEYDKIDVLRRDVDFAVALIKEKIEKIDTLKKGIHEQLIHYQVKVQYGYQEYECYNTWSEVDVYGEEITYYDVHFKEYEGIIED